MEKLSKSQMLARISNHFLQQDTFEERFVHKQTGRIISIRIIIELPEFFIDDKGIKWIKAIEDRP